jgi:hypothetical protein
MKQIRRYATCGKINWCCSSASIDKRDIWRGRRLQICDEDALPQWPAQRCGLSGCRLRDQCWYCSGCSSLPTTLDRLSFEKAPIGEHHHRKRTPAVLRSPARMRGLSFVSQRTRPRLLNQVGTPLLGGYSVDQGVDVVSNSSIRLILNAHLKTFKLSEPQPSDNKLLAMWLLAVRTMSGLGGL